MSYNCTKFLLGFPGRWLKFRNTVSLILCYNKEAIYIIHHAHHPIYILPANAYF